MFSQTADDLEVSRTLPDVKQPLRAYDSVPYFQEICFIVVHKRINADEPCIMGWSWHVVEGGVACDMGPPLHGLVAASEFDDNFVSLGPSIRGDFIPSSHTSHVLNLSMMLSPEPTLRVAAMAFNEPCMCWKDRPCRKC